ncbi:MAG: DUF427 domain-containing protein [Planctomycetota bacterium]|nr:MAG: DUF427 domain-containing protein [Planctomycetota bacterium]
MPKAVWNDTVLAESDNTIVVEGNHYFPPESLARDHLRPCDHTSFCGWKGTASYYDVVVDGAVNQQAAWYYPDPMAKAANLKDHVAFWKGVEVVD